MANSTVKIEWLPKGCEQLFKYDESIAAALQAAGDEIAEKNSRRILAKMHSPVYVQPYVADVRRLKHTQVCVVHSTTKAVAAAGRAYGFPKK